MPYKKHFPVKKIEIDGIDHFHCSKCGSYKVFEEMCLNKNYQYGCTRTCKVCYKQLYQIDKRAIRLESKNYKERLESIKQDNKEMKHINFWGCTDEDRLEVIEVMKRLGFVEDEPFHIQWHRKHGFKHNS